MKKLILSRRTIVGVTALIALMITLNVTASNLTTVTRWAAEYDNTNGEKRIEYANKILRIMHEEKLTDNLIEYSVNQNADIINQQVWYWLGEYFYYNQSYKLALEYRRLMIDQIQILPCNNEKCTAFLLVHKKVVPLFQDELYINANHASM